MVKLTVLYRKPASCVEFDNYYTNVHAPLAAKLPGLRRYEIANVTGTFSGESPYHMIAELYFDDVNALNAAMSSPEGKAAGKDVSNFAKDLVQMMICDVKEKVPAKI
jgi:uncharacterized protein (TIGR02118 family)